MLGMAEVVILLIIILYQWVRKCFRPLQTIRDFDLNDEDYDEKIQRMEGTLEVSNFENFGA